MYIWLVCYSDLGPINCLLQLGSLLSLVLRNLDGSRLTVQGLVQTQTGAGAVGGNAASGVGLGDELLAAGVDQEADEVGAHVVASKVGEDLGQMGLVEVNVDKEQAVKVLAGLGVQAAVGAVDAGVAVVHGRVRLGLDALGGVLLEALDREALEGRQGPGARLDGVLGGDQVRGRVGVW
jgi:hypothetical protein